MRASSTPGKGLRTRTLGARLAAEQARDALVQALDALSRRLRNASAPVRDAAHGAAEATQAVAQTAQRAAHAPQDVAHEVRREVQAWARGMGRMAALGALLGALGLFAAGLLTVALVELLDRAFGEPIGALVAGLLHLAGAMVALRAFREARLDAARERARHAEHRGEALAQVAEPMRGMAAQRQAERAG